MECPDCKQEMKKISQDISHNPRDKKKYDRMIYQRTADDVWLTAEMP